MISKRSFLAIAFVFGSFASVGCVGSTGESEGDLIELENARISQAGESLVVTGFANGHEESLAASEVTFVDRDANAIPGPDSANCYVCACEGNVCVCKSIG